MINYYDFILIMRFQQQCANAKYTTRFYNNYAIQLGSWTEINNPWGVDLLDKLSLLPFCARSLKTQNEIRIALSRKAPMVP